MQNILESKLYEYTYARHLQYKITTTVKST